MSLRKALPKPRDTGDDDEEELPAHTKARGPRVVGASSIDETQIALKRSGPPPYGQRVAGWRPRNAEDYGDGGAFPEVPVAQYPLDMGRKSGSSSTSNALAIQVDGEGKIKYDQIARRGHSDNRIIHTSFKDLIPLRQRADAGELSLERPSEDEIQATKQRTQDALAKLVSGASAAQKPKNVKGASRPDPTYVRYTPANQMGDNAPKNDRIMKIVQRQVDPMEPPKFKHKKIPRGPPSPPAPIMHSPPRKITAEEQEMWKIPPSISNWKNPKGYTVPLDKRLASDGRSMQDHSVSDGFAQLAEALYTADRHVRSEVQQRTLMQQKLAEKEKQEKEDHLRMLAQRAREERTAAGSNRRISRGENGSPPRRRRSSASSHSSYSSRRSPSRTPSEDEASAAARKRTAARRERMEDEKRQLRQSRMGQERRMQMLAREQGRDISEKIALGTAKPTANNESMFDSRLFNQTSGFDVGFNEDQPYDKPLFAAQEAISQIYRPKIGGAAGDDDDEGEETFERIQKSGRFAALGRGKGGQEGEDDAPRDGPVQFEMDKAGGKKASRAKDDDPFGIDDMIKEAEAAATGEAKGKKRYGLDDGERGSKRARVEED
ncbi:hypothetical protein K402DRAFT_420782 [Aulographum hederae CBS 113979]|uniref:Pre-mRNA-processing protein 45 n=1 Tax=Aulographum hederae CBS 113979 TaxID=1176131 RepID=A0A6G1H130_9PEZI|nr:hypothetical protein K402DRAFT_420782 [Aulographum hederae CBS 113979]